MKIGEGRKARGRENKGQERAIRKEYDQSTLYEYKKMSYDTH